MEIPIANTATGEISGAEPGTFEYFHEKAHIDFSKSNFGQNMEWFAQMSQFFTLVFAVLALFVDFFKWFALFGMVLMFAFFTYEEVHCNYQARAALESK